MSAVLIDQLKGTFKWIKQHYEIINKICGILLIAVGIMMATGLFDRMIAFLSQLTHCIAVSLMNCNTSEGLEKYTGDSFRDLTRIAKINDRMWSELFLMNKDALVAEIDSFVTELHEFRDLIDSGNVKGMREKMRASTARRSMFEKPTK